MTGGGSMSEPAIIAVEVTEILCARCAARSSPLSMGEPEYFTEDTVPDAECDTCGHRLREPDLRPERPPGRPRNWSKVAR